MDPLSQTIFFLGVPPWSPFQYYTTAKGHTTHQLSPPKHLVNFDLGSNRPVPGRSKSDDSVKPSGKQAGTNVLDSIYRRSEYPSEFLNSKPFDHHHRSVSRQRYSTLSVQLQGTNVLDPFYRRSEYPSELLNSNPFDHHHWFVVKAALLHSFSSAIHRYPNATIHSRHVSSVAPLTQFSQSAPASRFL